MVFLRSLRSDVLDRDLFDVMPQRRPVELPDNVSQIRRSRDEVSVRSHDTRNISESPFRRGGVFGFGSWHVVIGSSIDAGDQRRTEAAGTRDAPNKVENFGTSVLGDDRHELRRRTTIS